MSMLEWKHYSTQSHNTPRRRSYLISRYPRLTAHTGLKGECSNPLSAQIPSDQWIHSARTVKNGSNSVNSDNDSLLVPNNNLPASSASNLSVALTPAQSPSPLPSPTLSDHPSDDEDNHNDPFHDLVGTDNLISDDFFELLDEDEEIHSEIMDLPDPTPLVHQWPMDATIKNQARVASSLSELLSVGPIAAAESNVVLSVSSPTCTILTKILTAPYRGKYQSDSFGPIYDPPAFDVFYPDKYSHEFSKFYWYHNSIFLKSIGHNHGNTNLDCEHLLRPGEMVKCAGPSCHTQVRNQKASRSLPQG